MGPNLQSYIAKLTNDHKVSLIGGLAVIAHGFSRNTQDVDLWLDPMESPKHWLDAILKINAEFNGLTIQTLPNWKPLKGAELEDNIRSVGMIRVLGLECPLDLFREPNGIDSDRFHDVWKTGLILDDGTHLPTAVELLATKENTGRDRDSGDWNFLIAKSRREQGHLLSKAKTAAEAVQILNDFFDYEVCKRGLENQHLSIRKVILAELTELAKDGDPFAKEILEETT